MTKNTKNTDSLSSIVEKAVKAAGKSASKAIDKAVDKAVDETVKIADTPKAKEVKKSVQKVADEAKSIAADIKEGAKMIKEDTKEAAKAASTEAKAAVKTVRTKVSDVLLSFLRPFLPAFLSFYFAGLFLFSSAAAASQGGILSLHRTPAGLQTYRQDSRPSCEYNHIYPGQRQVFYRFF